MICFERADSPCKSWLQSFVDGRQGMDTMIRLHMGFADQLCKRDKFGLCPTMGVYRQHPACHRLRISMLCVLTPQAHPVLKEQATERCAKEQSSEADLKLPIV